MRSGAKRVANGKSKVKPSNRTQVLLNRIRRRREQIRDRVGNLADNATAIRRERELRS